MSILAARFPSAFILKGLRRPLNIGIDRDLAEGAPELSMPAIKQALRLYVGSASYQRALADGAEAPRGPAILARMHHPLRSISASDNDPIDYVVLGSHSNGFPLSRWPLIARPIWAAVGAEAVP